MALSTGTRRLLREAVSWAVVALIGAAAFTHFQEIKTGTERALGLPTEEDIAARQGVAGEELRPGAPSGLTVEIQAEPNGHFETEAEVNGRRIDFMVDTGATIVALSYEDAERAGLYLNDSDFTRAVTTANGIARVAPVRLDRVTVGDITVRDVPAAVAEPGRLKTSLLGMSFLNRLSRFDMRPGLLVLHE